MWPLYKCFSMTIEYRNYVRVILGLVERSHGGVRCYVIHFFSLFFSFFFLCVSSFGASYQHVDGGVDRMSSGTRS